MYESILDGKWFDELMKKTNTVIQNYYTKYIPIYQFILKYVITKLKDKCLVSSQELLLNEEMPLNEPLRIFVLDPYTIGDLLFKALCKKFGNGFVFKMEIKNLHYSIDFKTKHYIRISKINQYKNTSLLDFINPLKIKEIYVFPAILELIDLYKNVYNPEHFDKWESILIKINKIKVIADNCIKDIIKKNGGSRPNDKLVGKKCTGTCKENKKLYDLELKSAIIDFLKSYDDYILIEPPEKSTFSNISIISKNTIKTDFERLVNFLNDYSIIYKKKNLFIGKDLRISKHTIYLNMSKYNNIRSVINKPIIDIYNNTSYELIPYTQINDLKLIHPWAQIRFYYIEVWNILAAMRLDMVPYNKAVELMNNDINKIARIKIDLKDAPDLFMGFYINEYQAYKQEMIKTKHSHKEYC